MGDDDGFDPIFPLPPGANTLRVSSEVRAATFTLFYDDQFAGTAVAIGPRLIVTAGHHFKTTQNDPGLLRLTSPGHRGRKAGAVGVAYVQKDRHRDIMIMWPEEDVPYTTLRGYRPVVGSRVLTLYASPREPHQKLVESPGTVNSTTEKLCRSLGTVTTQGASGAPVLDSYGDSVVGLHLSVSDSAADGSWVSEFVPSAAVVDMLRDAKVDPAVPYRVEDEEKASPPRKGAKDAAASPKGRKSAAKSTAKKSSAKKEAAPSGGRSGKKAPAASSTKKAAEKTPAAGKSSPRSASKLAASITKTAGGKKSKDAKVEKRLFATKASPKGKSSTAAKAQSSTKATKAGKGAARKS
uniref:Serine protease n=1 Tax=Neobodo designis TaxID=312471 RepID=A0A7S1QNZ2_NEODS|mmetsp:Transcript_49575/g.153055  ORF Transcript_49575/g.153055 Transcript_49575/m.153055 type:complete len:352 (+) Transcript_49575:49-1104(+)